MTESVNTGLVIRENRQSPTSSPSPIDVNVGARIRLRRTQLGMSQEKLGDALRVSFQQIQKYERGMNRVGASRLLDLSRALGVEIGFFYEGIPGGYGASPPTPPRAAPAFGFAESQEEFSLDAPDKREAQDLIVAYYRISDPSVRTRVLDLIKSLGTAPDTREPAA
ncbi:helix-turn-helix domain-containing protein [Acidisoma cladoniae]|uniref:helix-turn-helix domain-containing protein n=1 Tax=Acidisoma cladoniae TaxID=3040935 RepID=UPI003D9C894B